MGTVVMGKLVVVMWYKGGVVQGARARPRVRSTGVAEAGDDGEYGDGDVAGE